MDDPQRKPKDSDRDPVTARIKRAADEGRISTADRDIRLGNVQSATSVAELGLMSRELDQLAMSTAAVAPPPAARSVALMVFVAIAAAAAAAVFIGFRAMDSDSTETNGPVATGPGTDGTPVVDAGSPYALTEPGITAFLRTYEKRFGTSQVVELYFYGDYAIVQVPVAGTSRSAGWLYRRGSGWTSFGGVRATTPGAEVFDTKELDVSAMARNIARAGTTLEVEQPAQTYVILRFDRPSDEVPRVDIYQTNKFGESGYLATTLDGSVKQTHPYSR